MSDLPVQRAPAAMVDGAEFGLDDGLIARVVAAGGELVVRHTRTVTTTESDEWTFSTPAYAHPALPIPRPVDRQGWPGVAIPQERKGWSVQAGFKIERRR